MRFSEPGHPNVSLSDWRAYQTDFPRQYLAEIIDRSDILFPSVVLPLARGVAFQRQHVAKAGHRPGSAVRMAGPSMGTNSPLPGLS